MKHLFVVLLSIILSACSTASTKEIPFGLPNGAGGAEVVSSSADVNNGMWGYPYSGIRLNAMWWDCWENFITMDKKSVGNVWGGYVVAGFAFIPLIADSVLSTTMDTLLLPVDFYLEPEKEHYQTTYCYGFGDTWGKDEA